MSHSLTTNGSLSNLNTALITDNALETDLFILTELPLPALAGSDYFLAEQAVSLRL